MSIEGGDSSAFFGENVVMNEILPAGNIIESGE